MTLCTKPPPMESSRPQRRPGRPPIGKKMMNREMPGKLRSAYRRSLDPCDNSNDSGLGFDHHHNNNNNDGHLHHHASLASERLTWSGERAEAKRLRLDIKMEDEEANDSYCFPPNVRQCKDNMSIIRTAPSVSVPSLSISNNSSPSSNRAVARCNPIIGRQVPTTPASLTTQLPYKSHFDIALTIVKQPEQQHRARYQTEGSRGAVKDRDGNGFPMVQLTGYYKPATLQVYIGTDVGKVAPHMFYQACKVSGKNSTPCYEKKIDGTCVIELALDPAKEMCANCDCVGILKERNVDVEHRFPDQLGNRNKKKSTRCRMIFRTTITHDNGTTETLQVCSQPIVCTQPPGIPEICKKSLTSCPASGGLELFVLGKNFLKDTKVYFQQFDEGRVSWEQAVVPDKEYLQQTHFVCVVPPYRRPNITEPVSVKLCVVSSGKTSDMHQFVYTPVNGAVSVQMEAQHAPQPSIGGGNHFFKGAAWTSRKREHDLDMMPPPESNMVPISSRRSSLSLPSTSDAHSPPLRALKQEYIDENSQSSLPDPLEIHSHERYRPISESSLDVNHDSNISMINDNSIDMLHHNPLMAHLNDNSNLSVNEDSVEMVRRSSMCESAEATVVHSMVSEVPPSTLTMMVDKGMDLRMKQSLNATVTDYVTNASSMATLKSFGIEPTSAPLPTQSAQSVENYLTKIESKPSLIPGENIPSTSFSPIKNTAEKTEMMSCTALTSALGPAPPSTQSVFLPTMQQPFVSEATTTSTIAKSEAAAIAEQTLSGTTNTSNTNTTITSTLEGSISTSINAPIEEIFKSSQNVLLTTEPPMLVPPPPINSTIASPVLQGHHSPEIMMNPQMSTGMLMDPAVCQASNVVTDASILPSPMTVAPLMPSVTTRESSTLLNAEPEKAVLLEAAADLFKTQKKINELTTAQSIMSLTPSVTESAVLSMPNCYVQSYNSSIAMSKTLSEHMPMPVKDAISAEQSDNKKNEDRIMAQAFTSLSENDLIDFINPSCFDQGNYNQ
ncbi:nuclear factor of activated T-cells 5 isoform X2 [Sitophilus oryzae]|uniref:Nuclear factor of activated T-cells 5 n=1 Tax=Sitophilus oryzae TaxID=7048 RepID=A0A6J2YB71_SITOR|nr:nuclear factor of activated T-cells 5 isoform X2 [Sitophilus oryzae]